MLRGLWPESAPSLRAADGTSLGPDIFLDTSLESLRVLVNLRGNPEPEFQLPAENRVQEAAHVNRDPESIVVAAVDRELGRYEKACYPGLPPRRADAVG